MTVQAPDWLNAEFVQKVLRKSEKDESIEVNNVATKAATAKGDNYMSDMIRATVEYSRNKSGRKVSEKISLIFKLAPSGESHRELVAKVGLFNTEIEMMESTLDKMNKLLEDEDYRLSARVLDTETGANSFLVIEDLAPLGFRVADRQAGLNLPHCILAMRGLAKFHASSVALCEKEPELMDRYWKGIFHEEQPEAMQFLFVNGMKDFSKEVVNWTELGPGYSEKILKLADVSYNQAAKSGRRKDGEFQVINHGDFWVNNMLFRYNDEGKVTDHIFVDFQLCLYASPAVDISYFLNTSPCEDVLINHRDDVLKEYITTLTKTMTKLGCKTKPPTMADLKKSLDEREFWGLFAACTILPYVLIDKNEAKSLDEIMVKDGAAENPAYKGALYRKTMVRRLPEWNKRGLLDV